jgi:hypothetical protein
LVDLPADEKIASLVDRPNKLEFGGMAYELPSLHSITNRTNTNFYRDFAQLHWFKRFFQQPVRMVVKNISTVAAADVLVEFEANAESGYRLAEPYDLPETPKRSHSLHEIKMPKIRSMQEWQGKLELERQGPRSKVAIACGTIQPGRSIWSDKFYIATRVNGTIELSGLVYASNRGEPQRFVIPISATMTESTLSPQDLYKLADAIDDSDD